MSRVNLLRAMGEAPQPTSVIARAAYIRSRYQAKNLLRGMERDGLAGRLVDADGSSWYLTEDGVAEKARLT